MSAWTDPSLERFAKMGPKNEQIAAALRPLGPEVRLAVMEAAREIQLSLGGGWVDVVRWTAAAAQAGADVRVLREILAGREWSLGRFARADGQAQPVADSPDG